MALVKFEIGGKAVAPAQITNSLERKVYESIVASLNQKFGILKCPTHREEPVFLVKGPSIDKVGFEVSACCPQMLEMVNKKAAD
jgi:hypothetical protein